jgi:hypothetical protein
LDVDLAGDFDENKVNEDDRQVDLLPGTDGPGDAPRVALWRLGPDRPTSQEFTEAMVAAAPTDSGYFLEAALPWKYMDFAPRPGARLGIAASVSDNDTPETNVQECMISTAPKRDWRDPTTWGTLILAEGRGSRPPEALPPRSELFPEARFALQEEHQLGSYVVRLWRNTTSETDWENIVTLAVGGQQLVQIEPVASLGDLTGKDITGEGHPDVIVERYSGGAHCCFSTAVYDLGPALTKVLETPESNCSGRFDDLDGDGVFEFVTCDDLFAYAYCPFAGSPMVKVILRYEPGRGYGPASPRFAHLYEGDIAEHTQLAEKTKPGEMGEWDGTTKCAVLPMVLDYLYAGMADRAWEEINRLYPYDDVKSFYAEIEQSVAKSPLFTPPR